MGYKTDLNKDQWELLRVFLEPTHKACRPRKHSTKRVVDAILYVLKTGCQWHLLPADFPPYRVVHYHFMRWSKRGDWTRAREALHNLARKLDHRKPNPSLGILDSRSVKTGAKRGLAGTTPARR